MNELYAGILKKNSVINAARVQPFDAENWLKWFSTYVRQKKWEAMKAMRKVISEGTKLYCEHHQLARTESTVVYQEAPSLTPTETFSGEILVRSEDCLETEVYLREALGLRPCVLNMASFSTPGGGWLKGAGAQEESIFRRSNYYEWLDLNMYPLPEFGGFYSPSVTVFRDTEANGYAFLRKPRHVAFIAASAYKDPKLKENGEELVDEVFEATKKKILAILDIALLHKHDSIVLSAFGCGAYNNPAPSMARAFKEVLKEYKDRFRVVAFAIIDDHNAKGDGNFKIFQEMFKE
jgi:uncharacterized protein (TIGR02452 family)